MPGHPLHNINGSLKHDLMNRSSKGSSSNSSSSSSSSRSSSSSSSSSSASSSDQSSSVVDVMNENQLCIQLYRELIHHLIASHHGSDDDKDDDDDIEGHRALVLQCIFGLYISKDIDHYNDDDDDDGGGGDSIDVNVYDSTIDMSNSSRALLVESFESSALLIDADADADIEESNVEATLELLDKEEKIMFIDKPHQPMMWQYEEIMHPPNSNKRHGVDGHVDGIGYSNRRNNAKVLSFKDAWPLRYDKSLYFVIVDPSSSSSSGYGWIVRNLLAMLSLHLPERDIYEDENEETNKTARIINFRGMI